MKTHLAVLRESVPGGAAVDTAVSRQLLDAVGSGAHAECLRLWQPAPALAFSGVDRTRPGFRDAVGVARELGFEPFVRLAGGHAAVYAPSLLAFVWTRAAPDLRGGIEARFADLASRVVAALCAIGIDARIGEVPGEFCPGSSSVNARGRVKLMGVGQRVVRGAAHIGGVLQVGDDAASREALLRVYAALALDLDPATFGSIESECGEASLDIVADGLLEQFARDHELEEKSIDSGLVARARAAADLHRVS